MTEFYRDFAHGFERDRIEKAVSRTRDDFEFLNERLSDGRTYLAGGALTLEDVAWMPNIHRFDLIGWPFSRTPHLDAWFSRIQKRQSYQIGLVDWEVSDAINMFKNYTAQRRAEGTDIRSFLG